MYKVIIMPSAELDLFYIFSYVKDIFKNIEAANSIYNYLLEEILSLSSFPYRCPLVKEETNTLEAIRKLVIEKYIAFYFVDESKKEVKIIRVLSSKREWQSII